MKKIIAILAIIISLTACKTKKTVTASAIAKATTAKKLVLAYDKVRFDKKTLSAKLKVNYKDANTTQNISASLRIIKDKKIWISISAYGFPVAKVLITPKRVSYYERINNTYFDGDFTLLSNFLGSELDYKKIQNLLVGEALLSLNKGKYKVAIQDNKYLLTPKHQDTNYDYSLVLNPDNFKVHSQKIIQAAKNLTFDYPNYQKISGTAIPKNLNITANDNGNNTTIKVYYKSVVFNKTLKTPFKIPSGYTAIKIE